MTIVRLFAERAKRDVASPSDAAKACALPRAAPRLS